MWPLAQETAKSHSFTKLTVVNHPELTGLKSNSGLRSCIIYWIGSSTFNLSSNTWPRDACLWWWHMLLSTHHHATHACLLCWHMLWRYMLCWQLLWRHMLQRQILWLPNTMAYGNCLWYCIRGVLLLVWETSNRSPVSIEIVHQTIGWDSKYNPN